ncbi:MAG TPA: phage tail spike protein, partial [Clostridia bacterium]|nr:phage tail spike protein [Clostridia bacterium]
MRLMIFDRDEKYVGVLEHLESAYHTEEINGINILEIKTKEHVEKGYRLIYQDIYGYWQEFVVKGVVESKDQNGTGVDVYAEHAIYETIGDFVEDKRPYDVPANTALEDALATTRWQVGIVDDLGKHSTNFYRISAKDALQRVAEHWKGELRYRVEVSGSRIINRYVDCLERLGTKTNKRFTYTKNLHGVKREFKREDVVTALYGFGKGEEIEGEDGDPTGGYGRRITFKEVNDGKAYVENTDALAIWGRNNQNGSKTHVFGQVVFDDCEDPEELKELTLEKLEELSKPQITYEGSVGLLGYVGLGDTVAVIDKDFIVDLRLSSRVVWIKRDLLNPKNNEIVLGNYKDFFTDRLSEAEDHINNFRDKQGVWDRSSIIDSEGTINTQYLNGVIDILKNQLLSTQSGWYTDDNGNIVFEKSDGMSAMMLTGSGFMIANTKDGNGDWVWRTFGTGDGFVADEIIAGILKGGKVKFDLTNGTLLIGNSVEDYLLLFDGQNLKINVGGKSLEEKFEEIGSEIIKSDEEPANPKDGQLWVNTSVTPNDLFIYSEDEEDWVYIGNDLSLLEGDLGELRSNLENLSGSVDEKANKSDVVNLETDIEDKMGQLEE